MDSITIKIDIRKHNGMNGNTSIMLIPATQVNSYKLTTWEGNFIKILKPEQVIFIRKKGGNPKKDTKKRYYCTDVELVGDQAENLYYKMLIQKNKPENN